MVPKLRSRWNSIRVVPVVGLTLFFIAGEGMAFGSSMFEPPAAVGRPNVTSLRARFRAASVTTVAGQDSTFEDVGRIYFNQGNLCIIREAAGLPEMQLLYVDGECLLYFPLSQYGHRLPPNCLNKQNTDFARFWRPLLAHLSPQPYLASLPGAAAGPVVVWAGGTYSTIVSDPDQTQELRARHRDSSLEYWGPVPDIRVLISQSTSRIAAVETVVHNRWIREGREAEVRKRTSARLANFVTIGGESIPTRIAFEERRPGQVRPSRRTVVDLTEVHVNEQLPDNAFRPIWPSDYIFLDVENRGQAHYMATADDPVSMIQLADYYYGIGQKAEGKRWLDSYEASLGSGQRNVSQVSNLARLYALNGEVDRGRELHNSAVDRVSQALAAATSPEQRRILERKLTQYLGECGFFISHGRGRYQLDDNAAAVFLESQIGRVSSPEAKARLMGRCILHYAKMRDFARATETLTRARALVGQDAAALQWLAACEIGVQDKQGQAAYVQRRRDKRSRIRELNSLISNVGSADEGQRAQIRAWHTELTRLQREP